MALSQELLSILVCPKCKGEVEPVEDFTGLVCRACALKYSVRDGVPVMLPDEAQKISGE